MDQGPTNVSPPQSQNLTHAFWPLGSSGPAKRQNDSTGRKNGPSVDAARPRTEPMTDDQPNADVAGRPGCIKASRPACRRGVIRERPTPAVPEMGTGWDRRFGRIAALGPWLSQPTLSAVVPAERPFGGMASLYVFRRNPLSAPLNDAHLNTSVIVLALIASPWLGRPPRRSAS